MKEVKLLANYIEPFTNCFISCILKERSGRGAWKTKRGNRLTATLVAICSQAGVACIIYEQKEKAIRRVEKEAMWSMSNRTERVERVMRTRTTLVPLVTLQRRRRRHRRRLPINHGPLATRTWRRKSCGLELRTTRTVRTRPRKLTSCCGTFCGAL